MEEKALYLGEEHTLSILMCDPVKLKKLVAHEVIRAETTSGHRVYRASDVLFVAARTAPDYKRRTPTGNIEHAVHRDNYEHRSAKVGSHKGKAVLIPPT